MTRNLKRTSCHFYAMLMQNVRRLTYVKDSGTLMQLVIDYPPLLPDVLQRTREEFEREAKMAMAVKLFEMKRLSSGMAARLAGMDRVSFLLDLHRYGVAMIDLDEAELQSELDNA